MLWGGLTGGASVGGGTSGLLWGGLTGGLEGGWPVGWFSGSLCGGQAMRCSSPRMSAVDTATEAAPAARDVPANSPAS